ncbi:MAG: T9SS type A sorting domain-containing protein [Bacteroidales bacterium]|nr:T9SS type A sorting domain-containing protein [Bacteroidales bacterium]
MIFSNFLSGCFSSCGRIIPALLLFTTANIGLNHAQQPAFPGAEGYGKYTSGGRGGTVYEVTNLKDSGPGSLRDAVSQPGRTVVFRVSGDIELLSQLVIMGNMTIAGQTAPGDGICVRDYPTKVSGDNVIIRYIRFRLGDRYKLSSDAFNINDRTNVILDHCTMSWGLDECFSAYGNNDVTIQYCIIGEGLDLNGHSMGGLWGGYTTYHHNLIHTNHSRHPKYAYTYDEDITDSRNNVIYNWGDDNSAYTSPTGRVNLANNYYKAGPATNASIRDRIVQGEPTKRMYITGNYVAGYPAVTADNWLGVDPLNGGVPIRYDVPFTVPVPLPEQSALDAYEEVVQHAGASFPVRDDADNRAIKNLTDSTGFILIRQSDAGGFPNLYSAPAPVDTDHDGMPDDYETDEGLNPNDDTDRNGDKNGNGYTNLEDYINGLVVFERKFPRPGFLTTQAIAEDKVKLSWYDLNDDENGFIIERSTDSINFTVADTAAPNGTQYTDTVLIPETTYYYRIRSFNDTTVSDYVYSESNTTFKSGALPDKAILVYPADNAQDLPVTGVNLQWQPGNYTLTYDIYVGTSETTLELKQSNYTSTSFNTGSLDFASDVYWRIDAGNSLGTTTGDVWKFSTLEAALPELLGYWPFDETAGNVVYDSTENGNDGTLKNIDNLLRLDGPFGGAISFSNSNSDGCIEIPHQPELAFDYDPFSISFWMRLDSITDASTYIIHKGSHNAEAGTEKNGKWFGLEMRNGVFRFAVDDNDKKTELSSSTSSFVTGEWVHVVIIRDVYKKKLWMYKNNMLNTQANDNTTGVACDLPLLIGNSDFEPTPYYGEIDELVICKHIFTAGEIDSLYRFNKIPTLPYIPSGIHTADILLTGLHVYPNPFSDKITIDFTNGVQNHIFVEIYNSTGQLVYNMKKAVIPNTRNRITWAPARSEAGDGLYLILIKDSHGIVSGNQKIMKIK